MLTGSTILFVSLSFVVILSTKRHGTLASKSIEPSDESRHCSRQDGQSYCHRSEKGTSELPSCSNVRLNMMAVYLASRFPDKRSFVGTMFSIDKRHLLIHENVLKQAKSDETELKFYYPPGKEVNILSMRSFGSSYKINFKILQHFGDTNHIELIKLDYDISNWEGIKMPIAKKTMYKDCILYSYSWSPIDVTQQQDKDKRWFSGHGVNITDQKCDSETCNFKSDHGGVCSGTEDLGSPIICQGYLAYLVVTVPDKGCSSHFSARNVAKDNLAKLISY